MVKIRVYVNSVTTSGIDYVDAHSLEHPCSQAGERVFEGLKRMPRGLSGFISDEEQKAIDLVEQFSKENSLDYEVIDLAKAGLTTRLRFIMKGWKAPVISVENEVIQGTPTKEQLEVLIRRQQAS